jgi:hypothetical protein
MSRLLEENVERSGEQYSSQEALIEMCFGYFDLTGE